MMLLKQLPAQLAVLQPLFLLHPRQVASSFSAAKFAAALCLQCGLITAHQGLQVMAQNTMLANMVTGSGSLQNLSILKTT